MVYSNNFGQSRVGIRNRVVNVVNSVDADAIAFIAAAGITNLTQAAAINTLVNDLKTYGLWTKMKALYPMVGGTATSHKFNLKDPRDLDAAFRLVFNGGWTHTSTGALPNGTTGYANSFLAPNAMGQNNIHVSFYSRTDINALSVDIGAGSGSSFVEIIPRYTGNGYVYVNTSQGDGFVNPSSTGLYIANRIVAGIVSLFKNNTKVINGNRGSNSPSTYSFYLGAENGAGTAGFYSPREQAFASIGDGLTDTESANFYNSVQKFQTTLGRQIGSPIVSDTDAQAFINAAGLTDLGQANAVNTLVTDLKAANIWTKMKAIYPFVGGTATTHKWNLKDPRDVDAAFRLTFSGGWVHSTTGAKPNGSNATANTFFNPVTQSLDVNNNSLSVYLRTNNTPINCIDIGQNFNQWMSATWWNYLSLVYIYNPNSVMLVNNVGTTSNNLSINTRRSSTDSAFFINGSKTGTCPFTNTYSFSSANVHLASAGGTGYYSPREQAFASIGDGLTDADAANFYTAVQKYQTSLGRQIGTPVLPSGQTAGLLETYSGAAAAYSLRKLRNGYVGNAIRVRRSSDNAEQDIAFDASGNLDTVSLLAFVGSGNGFVTTWYDQSGNSRHTVQTTATSQPYIVINGSISLQNGKPTLYFNGSSSWLQCSPFPNPSYQVEPFSLISVMGLSTGYSTSSVYCPYGTYNPNQMWFRINNNKYEIYNATTVLSSSINASSGQKIISNIFSDTDKLRVNGVEVISGNSGTYPQTYYGIGRSWWSGWYYNGYIQEHIVYISDQITNVSVLESNINTYYSIY